MLDINTPHGAATWGDVAGRRFVAQHGRAPERDDATEAWLASRPSASTGEASECFALAFMGRAAAELAAAQEDARREDQDDDERAGIERSVIDTLRMSRVEGHVLAQQEAARSALRTAIRYGLVGLAQRAAERLYAVQGALSIVMALRPLGLFVQHLDAAAEVDA